MGDFVLSRDQCENRIVNNDEIQVVLKLVYIIVEASCVTIYGIGGSSWKVVVRSPKL